MDVYTAANWATGFIEAYYLFVLCETFMERREIFNKYIYITGVLCLGILIDISNRAFSITLINIGFILLMGIFFSLLFRGNRKLRIMLPVLNYMIIGVTEMFILLILSVMFNESVNSIISAGYLRLIGILLSKILGYAAVKYISFKFNKKIVDTDIRYWILFLIMFAMTTVIMFTFCKVLEETYSNYIRNLMTVSACGLSAASVIIMVLYENALQQKFEINQNQLLEVKLKEQLKHYNNIMMTQGQVKKIKHDLKNHLIAIKAIIHRQENEKCISYIDTLLSSIELSNSYIDTGNTVLDAIISAKKTEAEKQGIDFNVKIRIPTMLPISQEDECVIFGNALDNAIEAAAKVTDKKYVNLSLILDKDALVCKISNSYNNDTNVFTTKKDYKNHGIGKYNIQEVLKKYNCVSRVICENNEYILSIIFMGLYKKQ